MVVRRTALADPEEEAGSGLRKRRGRQAANRASDLSTKDGDLVSEDEDLDGQIGRVTSLQTQELEDPEEGEIEKAQSHRQPSSLEPR